MKSQAVIGACTFWSLLLFCAMFSTGNSCFSQMDPGMGEGGVAPPDFYAVVTHRRILAGPTPLTPENNGQYVFDPPAEIRFGSKVKIENNTPTEHIARVDWKLVKTNISSVAFSYEIVSLPGLTIKYANKDNELKVLQNGPAFGSYQMHAITECYLFLPIGPPVFLLAPHDLKQIIPWGL